MKPVASEWVRKSFKKNKVWMAIGSDGNPLTVKDKVLIKYQLDQEHEYWVSPHHLYDIDISDPSRQPPPAQSLKNKKKTIHKKPSPDPGIIPVQGAITIYTDGASSGNPGPSGIGIYMEYGRHKREISKYIGITTNNVAELTAVQIALLELKRKDIAVRIYTDSKYVFSLLTEGWKAKKNIELINSIKNLLMQFHDIEIIKVAGHAGIEGNERADRLAVEVIDLNK